MEADDEPDRRSLLRELLALELEPRRGVGERVEPTDYLRRFPAHGAIIAAGFEANSRKTSGQPRARTASDFPSTMDAAPGRLPGDSPPQGLIDHPDDVLRHRLGCGGMGVVYLAYNRLLGREEVLKVIGPQFMAQPGARDRFLREMRAVARLRHPNVVAAYSAFRAGDSPIFAMEYVDGLDLYRMVKAQGPMPVKLACCFAYQATLGLQHAHDRGLVHRDIKPSSLMLTRDGNRAQIKVLRFGLARWHRWQAAAVSAPTAVAPEPDGPADLPNAVLLDGLTEDGALLGTPLLSPPSRSTLGTSGSTASTPAATRWTIPSRRPTRSIQSPRDRQLVAC